MDYPQFVTALKHYVIALHWTGYYDSGDVDDVAQELDTYTEWSDVPLDIVTECGYDLARFVEQNALLVSRYLTAYEETSPEQLGHDFALTRNGHGAGFWDRDLGQIGEDLTNASLQFPEKQLIARPADQHGDTVRWELV